MSDDEIVALRNRVESRWARPIDVAEYLALADEALARGAALAQTLENAEVLRLALKTDTEMFAECRERVAQLETALREDHDLLETAWGVIANAGGGDWTRETVEWRDAAACWRGQWHKWLDDRAALAAGKPASET